MNAVPPSPVRVALVEDHDGTRRELVASFEDHPESVRMVGAFRDAESFLKSPILSSVDVALVDIRLPGMSGIEAIRRLGESVPEVRAIVLTAFDDETNLFAALSNGAYGYLVKDDGFDRVIAAVEEAALGEHPVSSRVAGFLITRARRAPPPVHLTDREDELALALADGLSYAECAARMQIAIGTVQHHVKRLYRKLDVSSRKEVREWVQRNGLARD
ncbi:MAG: response regulator transcription factor [Polyangiaceae bacterium]